MLIAVGSPVCSTSHFAHFSASHLGQYFCILPMVGVNSFLHSLHFIVLSHIRRRYPFRVRGTAPSFDSVKKVKSVCQIVPIHIPQLAAQSDGLNAFETHWPFRDLVSKSRSPHLGCYTMAIPAFHIFSHKALLADLHQAHYPMSTLRPITLSRARLVQISCLWL